MKIVQIALDQTRATTYVYALDDAGRIWVKAAGAEQWRLEAVPDAITMTDHFGGSPR